MRFLSSIDWGAIRSGLGGIAKQTGAATGGGVLGAVGMLMAHEARVGHTGMQVKVERIEEQVEYIVQHCECAVHLEPMRELDTGAGPVPAP